MGCKSAGEGRVGVRGWRASPPHPPLHPSIRITSTCHHLRSGPAPSPHLATSLHCTALHRTPPHFIALYDTAEYSAALRHTAHHRTARQHTAVPHGGTICVVSQRGAAPDPQPRVTAHWTGQHAPKGGKGWGWLGKPKKMCSQNCF